MKGNEKPVKTVSIYTILIFCVLGTVAVLSVEPLWSMVSYARTGDEVFLERQERFLSFLFTVVIPGASIVFSFVMIKMFLFARTSLKGKK